MPTVSGRGGQEPSLRLAATEQLLDGFPGQLGNGCRATFGLVPEAGVQLVWQFHRRSLHGMPAYQSTWLLNPEIPDPLRFTAGASLGYEPGGA